MSPAVGTLKPSPAPAPRAATSPKTRAALVGASGYAGAELLRLLLHHPAVDVVAATSRAHAGRPVADVHRFLRGFTDLVFTDDDPGPVEADVVIFALPHGEAMRRTAALSPGVRVIDLSGDFRLRDAEAYAAAYGAPHAAADLLGAFVYGWPEGNAEGIAAARWVASPGCFATGMLVALSPLAAAGVLDGRVRVASATGSSGSGAAPSTTTHHPERAESYRAYRPLAHQHVPEVEQELARLGARGVAVDFVPHSAPFVRGIHTTAFVDCALDLDAARDLFESFYRGRRFVRLLGEPPDCGVVAGTNFVDVALAQRGRTLVVLTALDNLVKGGAGQAVQSLNLMLGLSEETGLLFPGRRP